MNIALWVLQVLVGGMFLMAGSMKAFSYEKALRKMSWVKDVGKGMTVFIGLSEFLGGLGLVLPAATRILPILTPVAAAALTVVMVLAFGFHLQRKEYSSLAPSLVLGLLTAFIAYGRFVLSPF